MVYSYTPLYIVGYSAAAAIATELLQYYFVYSSSRFKELKKNLEKMSIKVDQAKESTTSPHNLKKKEKAMAMWQEQAAKDVMGIKFKTMFFVSAIPIVKKKA